MSEKRHTYEYEIDRDSDTAPARVLSMVKPGSKVLEIGAGPGSITRVLVNEKKCTVVALEVEETALEKLRQICGTVYASDLNKLGWSAEIEAAHGKFDYVIAADVLEHVYNPSGVLSEMRDLLNDTGSVILSLPHGGHCAVLGCLVDEDFEYRDWGLLDRTHVRFFGIKNVQELYRGQGMAIEEAQFVVRTPEMTEFVARWKRLPQDVRDALRRNRFADVYQVVSRARPVLKVAAPVDLMEQTVPPTAPAIGDYWVSVMSGLPVDPARDLRTTIVDFTPPAPPRRKRFRGLRRLFAKLRLKVSG
ncbi:hypothetical protein HYN69_02745 [Gemmobacter aquarius]|uniref:Methyltransferase domain-containing protein n=1 Tax=Paragemmobacter aquarius TaxID=2169400 RepID=A0A2S0UIC6_9RHOB|nr:class I SAM-dependent methyltransferase [Gemmobacter aquarius]AWB47566.1 hypothetical protein HYN69_02745 [Gemmobacter aquarius]